MQVLLAENGNSDSLFMLSHHSDDYDSLRKRYEELLVSHNQAIEKLELAQDETSRLSKQCEDLSQERNNAVITLIILHLHSLQSCIISVARHNWFKTAVNKNLWTVG